MTENNSNDYSERLIKETLENLEVPFNAAHWEKMEQRLNAPFVEENPPAVEEIDRLVYPKLTRLEPAFEPKHWQIMALRLRLIADRKRHLASSKLVEMAIFLLLLLNLPGWLGIAPPVAKPFVFPQNRPVADEIDPKKGDRHVFSKNGPGSLTAVFEKNGIENGVSASVPNIENDSQAGLLSMLNPFDLAVKLAASFSDFLHEINPEAEAEYLTELAENLSDHSTGQPVESGHSRPLLPNAHLSPVESIPVSGFSEKGRPDFPILNPPSSLLGQILPGLKSRQPQPVHQANKPFLPLAWFYQPEQKRQFQLAFSSNVVLNHVKTPPNSETDETFSQLTPGYGAAITCHVRKGRWGFETGISYDSKKWLRSKSILFGSLEDGYFKQDISQFEVEMLGLPIHATARIGHLGRVATTAVAGVSIQVAARQTLNRNTQPVDNQTPSNSPILAYLRSEPETEKGLFEGGVLAKNLLCSAEAGLRFERHLSGKMSAFVQPTFHKVLNANGFGKKNDRVSAFSLQAGISATL